MDGRRPISVKRLLLVAVLLSLSLPAAARGSKALSTHQRQRALPVTVVPAHKAERKIGLPLIVATDKAVLITSDVHGVDHPLYPLPDAEWDTTWPYQPIASALRELGPPPPGPPPRVYVAAGKDAVLNELTIGTGARVAGYEMWVVRRTPKGRLLVLSPEQLRDEDRARTMEVLEALGYAGPQSAAPYRPMRPPHGAQRPRRLVSGPLLKRKDIRWKVDGLGRPLEGCYRRRVDEGLSTEGELRVRFEIDPSGATVNITFPEDTISDEALLACVRRVVDEASFDPPEDGQTFVVSRMLYLHR